MLVPGDWSHVEQGLLTADRVLRGITGEHLLCATEEELPLRAACRLRRRDLLGQAQRDRAQLFVELQVLLQGLFGLLRLVLVLHD